MSLYLPLSVCFYICLCISQYLSSCLCLSLVYGPIPILRCVSASLLTVIVQKTLIPVWPFELWLTHHPLALPSLHFNGIRPAHSGFRGTPTTAQSVMEVIHSNSFNLKQMEWGERAERDSTLGKQARKTELELQRGRRKRQLQIKVNRELVPYLFHLKFIGAVKD